MSNPTENGRDQRSDESTDTRQRTQNDPGEGDRETGKGHAPLKGTDTPATTDPKVAQEERGKRTTM